MARSKIDEMRSMVRRAEKAEAKLSKREIENIENGRKAREILKLIDNKTDSVISAIAEAYSLVPSNEVDDLVNNFVAELGELMNKYGFTKIEQKPKRSYVKKEKVEPSSVASVDYQENYTNGFDNLTPDEGEILRTENTSDVVNTQGSSVINPAEYMTNVQGNMNYQQPNNNISAGGISYDTQ